MESFKSTRHYSVSHKLVNLIERSADEITLNWLRDIKQNSGMPTYHAYDENLLYDRAFRVYSQLGKWISRETTKQEIAEHYESLGAERRREGFALSEVVQALIRTRRHLWLKIMSEGLMDNVLELNQAMELSNRVILFFDRAIYYTVLGYEKG
ncbi:MAG: hypothetical protein R6V02_01460 [Candidatus Aminicenantes bacterium]